MKFLVDAQLPPALADWIRDRGHEAISVSEARLRDSSDSEIWNHAVQAGFVVVTKDEDFAVRTAQTEHGPQVVWLRIGNSTNRVLFAWLEPVFAGIVEILSTGDRLVEVRRT